ncbi:helix-turn-helix transcriptional regulator [Actinomadura algeriensis]|uniref:AraC-like DNA-binding protein n=1 Tax=Actinomadura algeriensis TaxID=1679523 RepID=A0ABR9JKJ3_9ACTN|nr:helix-turn-helix domain-containing protein [Actinomadura algeriensis]MBE1530911.1 AraC-like DNA-binding protein [Actinomadura algeriensis]
MGDGAAYRVVRYRPDDPAPRGTGRLLVPHGGGLALDGADLPPGTALLLPPVHPARLAGPALALTVPVRELPPAALDGVVLVDVSAGLGRVVADMVRAVAAEADALGAAEFDAVCDRIGELLRMAVAGRAADRPSAPGNLAEVETVVRRYVRAHATDPGLTGRVVAQQLGWSLRQIQLALQRAGTTPRALIREERLRLVRDRLRDPADRAVSITDLAHAAGFSSAGALSTAFRRRFGVSPRELRRGRG